jgi:chemotaxis protein CheD
MSARPSSVATALQPAQAHSVRVLHPGDVALGERGERLETLLGSCVAIVLTDPRRTLGAMCHIVHSKPATAGATVSAAYADVALERMYTLLRSRGIEPTLCEAYVYGGGNMFPALFAQGHVGDDNARWALNALAHDGVRVLFHDLGGNTYRRLSWAVGPDMPQVTAVAV